MPSEIEERGALTESESRVIKAVEDYSKTAKELAAELGLAPATVIRIIRRLIDANYLSLHSKKLIGSVTIPYYIKISPENTGDVRKVRSRPAVPGDSPMRADTAAAWMRN
jgi:transcription initiation factor IIE alpha subunit